MRRCDDATDWPELNYRDWQPTAETLHLWTQIVGKVRLAFAPPQNHWWQVGLTVTADGLTTGLTWCGARGFQIDFDLVRHRLAIATTQGERRGFALEAMSVAEFHRRLMRELQQIGIEATIWPVAVELPSTVHLDSDEVHGSYDPSAVDRFRWATLLADEALQRFRSRFIGKCSPVLFFWGGFDLACSRFSGKTAPPHPGAEGLPTRVTREAYSHEVSSAGFWPGSAALPEPIFFSYTYPEPEGFAEWPALPDEARYDEQLREFVLPYESVRRSRSPGELLSAFFQASYEAGAVNALWNRDELERPPESASSLSPPLQSTANVPLVTP